MSSFPKRIATKNKKKLEKLERIKREENLFVVIAASDTCLILRYILILKLNIMARFLKELLGVKMVRLRKEGDLKM
jgi:hypothetical protein